MATPPIETEEPRLFAVGNTLIFQKLLRDYLPSDGWTIFYEIRGGASGDPDAPVTFSSTASGDYHLISVTAATTAEWIAGDYTFAGFVTNGTVREAIYLASLTLGEDFGTDTDNAPALTHTQKMITLLEAALEKLAATSIEMSTVQQSTFLRAKRLDLEKQLAFNKELRQNEIAAEAIRNGQPNPHFIRPLANITQ